MRHPLIPLSRRRLAQGFTVLEMALSLFTIGLLIAGLPSLIRDSTLEASISPSAQPPDRTEVALMGFLLSEHRLPCPAATAVSGVEDCSRSRGYVPYRALGLAEPVVNSRGYGLAYAVYAAPANSLVVASAAFTPVYLQANGDYWRAPSLVTSQPVNGLDFCAKLRRIAVESSPSPAYAGTQSHADPAQARPMAWVLVDPGRSDADQAGAVKSEFDGLNATALAGSGWFESPERTQSSTYDDMVRAVSPVQLFGQMQCPSRLSAVSAAAREVDFAVDHWRVWSLLRVFREGELEVRKKQFEMAKTLLLLAQFDVSFTAALGVLDLGIALASASGAGSIAATVVNSVATITLSALSVQNAEISRDSAEDEVAESERQVQSVVSGQAQAVVLRDQRLAAFLLLDQRGLFQ
jgi:hypothetical protein